MARPSSGPGDDAMQAAQRRPGFFSRIGGVPFLIAQLLTVASTIVGVYLAGFVGFQRTLEYDRLQKARAELQLLRGLHAEGTDNASRLRAFIDDRMVTSGAQPIYGDWPRLRLYLWRAAGQNPALFEAPSAALSGMQGAYADIEAILSDEGNWKTYRNSSGGQAYDRKVIKDALDAAVTELETAVLPQLAAAKQRPSAVVRAYEEAYPTQTPPTD